MVLEMTPSPIRFYASNDIDVGYNVCADENYESGCLAATFGSHALSFGTTVL